MQIKVSSTVSRSVKVPLLSRLISAVMQNSSRIGIDSASRSTLLPPPTTRTLQPTVDTVPTSLCSTSSETTNPGVENDATPTTPLSETTTDSSTSGTIATNVISERARRRKWDLERFFRRLLSNPLISPSRPLEIPVPFLCLALLLNSPNGIPPALPLLANRMTSKCANR